MCQICLIDNLLVKGERTGEICLICVKEAGVARKPLVPDRSANLLLGSTDIRINNEK